MDWWVWFVIGAGCGVASVIIGWVRQPADFVAAFQGGQHPYQGLFFVAVLGAATVGTGLWLVFGVLLGF
jgi:hypothetical protein